MSATGTIPSATSSTFGPGVSSPTASTSSMHSGQSAAPRRSRSPIPPLAGDAANPFEPRVSHKLTPESVGRAVAARVVRMVRRGNLPFLIVFLTALFIFFGALAGVGYVDPDAKSPKPADPEFVVGGPVFDPNERQRLREQMLAEQRELEQAWARNKRPNAGAWMQKSRDDRAVRVKGKAQAAAADVPRRIIEDVEERAAVEERTTPEERDLVDERKTDERAVDNEVVDERAVDA